MPLRAHYKRTSPDGKCYPDLNHAEIYAIFKDTKVGFLLKIKIRAIVGQGMYDVISAEPYKLAPGEDKPGVYIFQRTATMTLQKTDHPAVVLSKYLEETTLAVMDKKTEAALGQFKTGTALRSNSRARRLSPLRHISHSAQSLLN